jgi:hypothetical protein
MDAIQSADSVVADFCVAAAVAFAALTNRATDVPTSSTPGALEEICADTIYLAVGTYTIANLPRRVDANDTLAAVIRYAASRGHGLPVKAFPPVRRAAEGWAGFRNPSAMYRRLRAMEIRPQAYLRVAAAMALVYDAANERKQAVAAISGKSAESNRVNAIH